MAAKGGAPTASGEPELVEGTSACDGSGAGAGGGLSEGAGDVSVVRDTPTSGASPSETDTSPSVPENTQTRAAEDQPSRPSPPPATPSPCPPAPPASRATSSPPRTSSPSSSEGSSSIAVLSSPSDSPDSSAVFVVPRSPPSPSVAGTETSPGAASPGKASNSSANEFAGASAREYQRSKSNDHAGARPKHRSPISSTPLSPRRAADTISTTSSISMLAQQGSFRSASDVSFSPSVGGDVAAPDDTPRRFSGSTEDDGERERHHGGHWHLPFRKKMTIEVAKSPPKSVSFLDEVDPGSPLASEFGEEHHKEHHRSFGHAISHSSLGRAMSHSSIGHAVSHFFKKGHHSPPSSAAAEKRNSAPGAVGSAGGAGLRSSQSHHSIGHVVAEFFRKGVHHHSSHETISTGRSGTPPIEVGEDVVSSLPSGPDEGDSRNESSTPVSSRRAASTSAISASSKSPQDQQLRENASTGSNMGHAVAKAFKKFNASIVGSPGKPPRWKTWRRGGEQDPRALRDRRRSLPGRRLSESAAIASYETSMLSLLRRRRSASRSPDRRVRSPKARSPGRDQSPPPRETAMQRLRRQALRRHLGVLGFLHLRRWRSSCPDLSKLEQERVNPPIRHVVMRRAIVDELERIVLLYPGDKLKQWFQLFEWEGVNQEDESQIYIKFFKFHKCYDLIPTSAKLVVFDTQLLVKKAFFALVYNGVRAAPLWDSKKQQYVGMLTITDFIRILQMYYRRSDERIEELEEHKLETWRTVLESDSKPLIFIEPEASLFDAITILLENKIHRLPVIDPKSGDVLYIITHKRILRFLCLYLHNLPRPSFLGRTLADLRIGTYDKIETARPDTPVIEALTKFVERRVSALPIVDSDNKLTHIYAKFDVINLAAEKTYNNLNVPLMTANSHRSENKVEACRLSDTLMQVLEKIVHAEVHRLVITDDEQRVIGIISLSDILDALVIRPHEYNTLPECNSAGSESGDDERHMIVEEEPGDEEDPVAAAAGIERLSLSDGAHKDG